MLHLTKQNTRSVHSETTATLTRPVCLLESTGLLSINLLENTKFGCRVTRCLAAISLGLFCNAKDG